MGYEGANSAHRNGNGEQIEVGEDVKDDGDIEVDLGDGGLTVI